MRPWLLLPFLLLPVISPAASGTTTARVSLNWTFDSATDTWTSHDTGLVLPPRLAGFKRTDAEPAGQRGDSYFGYSNQYGIISIFVEHYLVAGFKGRGDHTRASRDGYLEIMHRDYGRTDLEKSFRLQYAGKGKRGQGVGTLCHFLSFPKAAGRPAYSEVGIVQVGDFLIEIRGTFVEKEGVETLNQFLRALGMKKS